jgi:DUF4097 and DUF4098 domain-containing protein YvlB
MSHRRAIVLALALTVGAAGLAGCADKESPVALTGEIEGASIGEGSGSGELLSKKQSFAVGDFDSIEVDATAMEIYVTKTDGDQAEIELLTDKAIDNRITMDAFIRSRQLRLRVDEETRWRLLDRAQKGQRKLRIALPDKRYDRVRIQNEFGLVDADDLKADHTRIKLAAGSIRISGGSGELDLRTDAGNIAVERPKLERDLSARTSAGDITIDLKESPEAADIDLRSEIGSVDADLDNLRYITNMGNRIEGTIGSGGPRLEADTETGRILVR